jgi:flagellar basal-body rod protein FlgG
MDALTISAASGLRARMESLEMLANNLANNATGGYKADREFYSLYLAPEAQRAAAFGLSPTPTMLPVIERHWTDFSQGLLRSTANPFDLALSERGFFSVNGPSGRLYTRNGNFRLSATGVLATLEGYPVRAVGGGPLQMSSAGSFEVSADGTVVQDGQVVGQLEVVDFGNLSVLSKEGGSYFRNLDPNVAPVTATGVKVHQGKLESSNVAVAEGAVRLVSVMRQFEMLQRAISLGSEMNRRAVEEVARVGS